MSRLSLMAAMLLATAMLAAQTSNLWIDVPFVAQTADGCGAASVAMVMKYWSAVDHSAATVNNRDADATYIFERLHSSRARGIYASQIESYLREHGYQTFAFRGTWDDLRQHLAKGRPLIVGLKPLANRTALHYVVVAGIDDAQGLIMFNDPAGQKLAKLDRRSFEKEWSATQQWTLLAVPRSSAP